jgi:hypothetical protein
MSDINHSAESIQTNNPDSDNPEKVGQSELKPQIPFYRKGAFQALSGAVLFGGAMGVAIGSSLGANGSESDDNVQAESIENIPEENAEAEQPLNPAGEEARDDGTSSLSPETFDEEMGLSDQQENDNGANQSDDPESLGQAEAEYSPILMDATTPTELVSQQEQNYDCIFNAPLHETQLECVRFTVGDGRTGDLSSNLRDIARQTSELRDTNPDWIYESTFEIIDSSLPKDYEFTDFDGEVEFIVKINEYDTDIYKRYHFIRTIASEVTELRDSVDREVNEQLVWVLRSDRSVEPGTQIMIN